MQERYNPGVDLPVNRRRWFQSLGAGIAFQIVAESQSGAATVAARLHIAPDRTVTLLTGKVDIGQGARTLLTQCVAEELHVDPAKVRLIMGDTATVPDDGGTYGSLTTPLTVPAVRRAAAGVRELLRTMTPELAMRSEIPIKVDLTQPAEWKVLGSSLPNVSGREVVTGALKYSTDIKVPGMFVGKVIRPEAYTADLVSYDAGAAGRIPGVKVVRDGNLLGVVAPDESTASKAAGLVRAEWKQRELLSSREVFAYFKKNSTPPVANPHARYPPLFEKGSAAEALAKAKQRHQADYTIAHIAHAPIEPRAAVALWDDKGLTVHCGSQVPFGVRKQLADAFGINEREVRVTVPATGTGFGGKHGPEVALEAAKLSKAAGKPVRVAWTREDEFVRSYCRPAGLMEVRSSLDAGRITAWDFHNYNSGPASLLPPYAIPDYWCGFHRSPSVLRQGAYRSLAGVANTFARETHVDELAALAGEDPVAFRLRNIENARLREVIERAATAFGWTEARAAVGMACNIEKDAHIALFTEIEGTPRDVHVRRMVMAFDCGAVLNPDYLRNQITGALIQGIGGALFEELRYDGSKVLNNRFSDYRVPRFSDAPQIDVILVDRREVTPAGAGESPITVVAPALGAAIYRATGRRLRALPFAG
jgi:nicotinate dehydrogenase subunit B